MIDSMLKGSGGRGMKKSMDTDSLQRLRQFSNGCWGDSETSRKSFGSV